MCSSDLWEWCADWYGPYAAGGVMDPQGPQSGVYRVHRGGGWYFLGRLCRSADRYWDAPGLRNSHLGFRVVLVRAP